MATKKKSPKSYPADDKPKKEADKHLRRQVSVVDGIRDEERTFTFGVRIFRT